MSQREPADERSHSQDTVDRRRSERAPGQSPLRLHVESTAFEGSTENVSDVGVLFYTDKPLCVRVELVRDGQRIERTGKIVRVQRMDGDNTGFAVEFDPT